MMVKFIRNIVLGSIFAFAVYLVGLLVVGSLPMSLRTNLPYFLESTGFTFERFEEADTVKDVDVLIMGSSHAYRSYDTRIFEKRGLRCFNLGSSAQTPVQTNYLLHKYLDKLDPELVIVDVYPELFQSDGVESTIDLLINTPVDEELLELSLESKNIRPVNVFFYSLMREKLGWNDPFRKAQSLQNAKGKYIHGGYVASAHKYVADQPFPVTETQFFPGQIAAFEEIVHTLQKENIDYVLFQAPLPTGRYQSITNTAQADSLLRTYGTYFNANNYLQMPDSCFFDASHLNQMGVDRYNAFVCRVLDSLLQSEGSHATLQKTLSQVEN